MVQDDSGPTIESPSSKLIKESDKFAFRRQKTVFDLSKEKEEFIPKTPYGFM